MSLSTVLIKNLPVKVESVKITGIERTRESFIKTELEDAVASTNMRDLNHKLNVAAMKLKSLGVFDAVDIQLNTESTVNGFYVANVGVTIREKIVPTMKVLEFYL